MSISIKKNVLIKLLVFCLSLAFFVSNGTNHSFVYAEPSSVSNIGYFYSTQAVNTQTKVYVILNSDEYNWAIECGRTINQEFYVPLNNDDFYELENTEPDAIDPPPLIRYFYYATSTSPIITGKRMLSNNLDSLLFVLTYKTNAASAYGIENSKNAILGYIRAINANYVGDGYGFSDSWTIICGNHQSSLPSVLNGLYAGGGIKIYEYFASFISGNDYNSELYGNCGTYYLSLHYYLVDPLTENACIDLIHMFASLDGVIEGTGEATQSLELTPYITKDTYRYLVSWAGDLQTAAKSVWLASSSISSFEDVLSGNYGFDYYDYYADLDAVNIGTRVNLGTCGNISSLLASYYEDLVDEVFEREELFIEKVASTHVFNCNDTEEAFIDITCDMLRLLVFNNIFIDGFEFVGDYLKYHLLYNNLTFTSYQSRCMIETNFLDYLEISY